jgi:hypothetical protein
MYQNKMKVIGAIALALGITVGFVALSATSVGFAAAGQPSMSNSQPQQIGARVPGWCNWDNDKDEDDWCWSTTAASTAPTTTITPTTITTPTVTATQPVTGNGYTAPSGSSAVAPAGIVPYGTIVGQIDPYQDVNGYNNNYNGGMGYNNRYDGRYYFFRPRRLGRRFWRNGMPVPVIVNGKIFLGRNWWWWMQP